MIKLKDLVEGDVYLFKYEYKSGNGRMVKYEMAARFVVRQKISPIREQLVLSLRPLAGTQNMPVEWITDIKEATQVRMPERQKPSNDGPQGLKDMLRFR